MPILMSFDLRPSTFDLRLQHHDLATKDELLRPKVERRTPKVGRSSYLSTTVRRNHVGDLRRLFRYECFTVARADERAEMLAPGFDHLQKPGIGDERSRFLRLRIVELRLIRGNRSHLGFPRRRG